MVGLKLLKWTKLVSFKIDIALYGRGKKDGPSLLEQVVSFLSIGLLRL